MLPSPTAEPAMAAIAPNLLPKVLLWLLIFTFFL